WERSAAENPHVRTLRRGYECEVMVLRHRLGGNHIGLSLAWRRFRSRVLRQRAVRIWFRRAEARRCRHLTREAFSALGRAVREGAALQTMRRRGALRALRRWRAGVALGQGLRAFMCYRLRSGALQGLRLWQKRTGDAVDGGSSVGVGGRGNHAVGSRALGLDGRLELFRERRAKRRVLLAWRALAARGAELAREDGVRKGEERGRVKEEAFLRWSVRVARVGSRLRAAEAVVRHRRLNAMARQALLGWRAQWLGRAAGRARGLRRALGQWRAQAQEAAEFRAATEQARARYLLSLGRRTLAAWSVAALTLARCREGAVALRAALRAAVCRAALRWWRAQALTLGAEVEATALALEHNFDRMLRVHLRAWGVVAQGRRKLRGALSLMVKGSVVSLKREGFRWWRRWVGFRRLEVLRAAKVLACRAAATRLGRHAVLARSFRTWSCRWQGVSTLRSLLWRMALWYHRRTLTVSFHSLLLAGLRVRAGEDRDGIREGEGGVDSSPGDLVVAAGEALGAARAEGMTLRARVEGLRADDNGGGNMVLAFMSSPDDGAVHPPPGNLTEREGAAFGRLQAETLGFQQRSRAAEEEAARLQAATRTRRTEASSRLKEILGEGRKLKAEAEGREAHVTTLRSEAESSSAAASQLADHLASMEQDLAFETARSSERLWVQEEGITRLQGALEQAEAALTLEQAALQQKDLEIGELRARAARAGIALEPPGKGRRRATSGTPSRGGRRRGSMEGSSDLEFRSFAVMAVAQVSAERAAVAATKRSEASGAALAEALRSAAKESAVAEKVEAKRGRETGGENSASLARQMVRRDLTEERRATAALRQQERESELCQVAHLAAMDSLD
ncbi:unnamed protein product, partial [Discosporangium mesarthrocarpum]